MDLHPNLIPGKKAYELYDGIDYLNYWKGDERQKLDILERIIVSDLLPASGKYILDMGCGYARLFNLYENRFEKRVLIDGSMTLLEQARQNTNGKAILVAGDVYHLPFKNGVFDTAMLIRVFQHLTDPKPCFTEVHRVLCNRGNFVFSYYNKMNPSRILKWILGKQKNNPFTLEPEGIGSEFISHHPNFVKNLIKDTGFQMTRVHGSGVFDQLAEKMGKSTNWIPLGRRLSPFLGRTRISPWIFSRNIVTSGEPLKGHNDLVDLFACPVCQSNLSHTQTGFSCTGCNRDYQMVNGIYDFRI
jgi:ubiquinone/menaquinone biosynthesis C-methylase UbiE